MVGVLYTRARPQLAFVAIIKCWHISSILPSGLVGYAAFPPFVALIVALYISYQPQSCFNGVHLVILPARRCIHFQQIYVCGFIAAVPGSKLECHFSLLCIRCGIRRVFTIAHGYIFIVPLSLRVGFFQPLRYRFQAYQYFFMLFVTPLVNGIIVPAAFRRRGVGIAPLCPFHFPPV